MDIPSLLFYLKTFANTRLLTQGKLVHQKIVTLGLQNNVVLSKNLITFYFSCQDFKNGKLVFQSVNNPFDISLWNGLMAAYTKNFKFLEVLDIFRYLSLNFDYISPDNYTYPSVLKSCSELGRVDYGRIVHGSVLKRGYVWDVVVASSVVGMYAKCGFFGYAMKVFDEMPIRDVPCWNAVMSCYYHDGQWEKALELFGRMKGSGFSPDSVSYTTAISSCARLLDLERGKDIHHEMVSNRFPLDSFVSAALVDMYGKCGCLETAIEVFDQMPRKSLVSWNSMMAGYRSRGDSKSGIKLLWRMIQEGKKPTSTTLSSLLMTCSNSMKLLHGKFLHGYMIRNNIEADMFILNTLVDLYFKCHCVKYAEFIFRTMTKTDVVAWNVMISGYVSVGCYLEAIGIYNDMKEAGIKPDAFSLASVLAACSQLGALKQGKEIHKSVSLSMIESNQIVVGALLDMYAKCGAVNEAISVFNQLRVKDLVSWTSMIMAYGSHGQACEALKLFKEMQKSNIKPDRVTFLAVISACSHAGLVDEGLYYYSTMINNYGIQPTIAEQSCLIDLLGRAGKLQEAYGILQRTPNMKDDIDLLSTLLSACHMHGELELGEEIASLLIERDPNDPSTYIILAKMYASGRKWNEARKVRLRMKELGLKKNPGCSWIEIDGRIKPFFVEDTEISQQDMIYSCLSILASHMEKDEVVVDDLH
ncbi:Pentatricopeptide repeat-containing protein [Heracleum sosnowskyi]|uniref:Pentatricopeptide repeat-containing protein n=1 Tax=Heracleum sosnowskyi TaxID=360622 RepID=A0AAD8M2K5_9APIA|nr:Pentatricopeptide repeat-containing protein [Heracleum sosnowskyi]